MSATVTATAAAVIIHAGISAGMVALIRSERRRIDRAGGDMIGWKLKRDALKRAARKRRQIVRSSTARIVKYRPNRKIVDMGGANVATAACTLKVNSARSAKIAA